MDGSFSIRGTGHADGVDGVSLCREAEVGRCVRLDIGVVERATLYLGWAFAEDLPRRRRIDGFAIDLEPCAHLEQRSANLIRDSAIGAGTEVEQQVAILADDIDELMHKEFRWLEGVVLD